jgi:hypothetical protein
MGMASYPSGHHLINKVTYTDYMNQDQTIDGSLHLQEGIPVGWKGTRGLDANEYFLLIIMTYFC